MEFGADDPEEEDSAYRPALFGIFGEARLPNLSAMRLIIRPQRYCSRYVLGGIWGRGVVKEPEITQRGVMRPA